MVLYLKKYWETGDMHCHHYSFGTQGLEVGSKHHKKYFKCKQRKIIVTTTLANSYYLFNGIFKGQTM